VTELGEPVSLGMVDTNETECPFDHDFEPLKLTNDLIGEGQTLGRRMKSPVGTHTYAGKCAELDGKFKEEYPKANDKILNPKHRADHALFKGGEVPVHFPDPTRPGTAATVKHIYPLTCAAHHCIPGQESLKRSQLLQFMVKKGDSEAIKGGSFGDGQVWADVGYDVNGLQNGVYLPGNYAVSRLGKWDSTDDLDEDGPEDNTPAPPGTLPTLSGGVKIDNTNTQWQYVKQAVKLVPGQFHDRHEPYSDFVLSVLDKIYQNYCHMYMEMYLNDSCSKCKKKQERMEKEGVPTPYALVSRLNKLARNLQTYLNGTAWRPNIFTSRWGKAYMDALAAKNPDAI